MKNNLFLCLVLLISIAYAGDSTRYLQWNDPGCSRWNQDGTVCLQCSPRQYWNSQQSRCIAVDDNCKTWSETNGDCVTCYDSYGDAWKNGNAIDGKCPYYNGDENITLYDINCKCFDENRTCSECYEGYTFDQNGRCQQESEPELPQNCRTAENGVCVECLQGYVLNSNSTCVLIPANCANYTEDGECTQCNTGYWLDTQGDCNLLPSGCVQTDDTGVCSLCEQGYFLDNQGDCQLLPENCIETDDNGLCVQCSQGYFVNIEKQCQILPDNCLAANEDGECTQCQEGWQIENGTCTISIGSGQPNPDCAQQNDEGDCTKCRQFYNLIDGDCVPTGQNPFCKTGACECGTGNCLECQDGYFLDNNFVCIKIGQNCAEYSRFNGECTQCLENFTLSDGQCVPQDQEVPNVNLNCKSQDSEGRCVSCRKYYQLNNGTCIPTGQNPKCRIYSQDEECVCCYYGYRWYLDNNNICVPKNAFCKQINPQNGQCTECYKHYNLEAGECVLEESEKQQTNA